MVGWYRVEVYKVLCGDECHHGYTVEVEKVNEEEVNKAARITAEEFLSYEDEYDEEEIEEEARRIIEQGMFIAFDGSEYFSWNWESCKKIYAVVFVHAENEKEAKRKGAKVASNLVEPYC